MPCGQSSRTSFKFSENLTFVSLDFHRVVEWRRDANLLQGPQSEFAPVRCPFPDSATRATPVGIGLADFHGEVTFLRLPRFVGFHQRGDGRAEQGIIVGEQGAR